MKSETLLDYAVFQLSPKRSRCDLFVSSYGKTEKLASGLVKPFVTHLKVAEEQVALAAQSIKLEVEKYRNAKAWFTKGTLERFVRFVSTPEVLELVSTFDAEMSQLEAALSIYAQGVGDQLSGKSGGDGSRTAGAADATKKELLRAMDVRLVAVRQDLTTACARASAAGFNPDTVAELQLFADRFGAHRLNEACREFVSVCQRRPDLINHHQPSSKSGLDDRAIRSSTGSDMSIDDPTEDHFTGSHQNLPRTHSAGQSHIFIQSNPSTCQQPNSPATTFPVQDKLTENNDDEEEEKKEKKEATESTQTIQQPTRRLSVQDRINLFENKQKENSGGKPTAVVAVAAGKPSSELRRLSSDVSSSSSSFMAAANASTSFPVAPEKAVLRRWTAASDISIDLSGCERKDTDNSPIRTPSYSSLSHQNNSIDSSAGVSIDKDTRGLNDTASSAKGDVNSTLFADKVNSCTRISVVSSEEEKEARLIKQGVTNWKDHASERNQLRSFSGKSDKDGLNDQPVSEEKLKMASGKEEYGRVKEKSEFPSRVEDVRLAEMPVSRSLTGGPVKTTIEVASKEGNSFTSQLRSQSFPEKPDSFTGLKLQETFPVQNEEVEIDSFEDSKTHKLKFQKQDVVHEQLKKLLSRKEESSSTSVNRKSVFPVKKVAESEERFDLKSMAPNEQVQRVKPGRGNQELNDELKLKANELEKLFAEHQLRVPGDQSTPARRNKPADTPEKTLVPETTESPTYFQKFNTPPVMKTADIRDYASDTNPRFCKLPYSDDSRGKFYDKYMQKRDAKLKEEWGTKRPEKEAKMKAMQDSLERSSAELKVRFAGSADKQDSVLNARRRAEKLRSFNVRSNMKDQPIDYSKSDDDEDVSYVLEQRSYGQDKIFDETSLVDSDSRITQVRKPFPGRNLPSSMPRSSVAPAPRSSVKAPNSIAGRRRAQAENPLALSVPNFSDFRKENTKPSVGASRTSPRIQVRTHVLNKSNSEELSTSKDEKSRRSQFLRRSSVGPVEFKETPLSSDELNGQSLDDKLFKSVESRRFLRKGNGIGPGAGASAAKLKASIAPDAFGNEDEYEELPFEPEDSVDMVKQEEFVEVAQDFGDIDDGRPSAHQESDNSASENGDDVRSPSPVDSASVAELPTAVPSVFHALGSLQDSPGESPMSWNARSHNMFSYPHEISDIDASIDSPIGSPASWNSHSLAQTEADAARMRKKWGSAQKPIIVANSSHNQSRKDMTKGFKRLLKLGRKSRGSESLADWISATTSEGDDDTEDGRDPANRLSDDLRKSRMGFSHSHASDDGFNDIESYNEQVQGLHSSIPAPPANFKLREDHVSGSSMKAPRSFFSLSSFRSKGSESKPR